MTPNKEGRKHTMRDKKNKDVYLQAKTMIDPATDWAKMHSMTQANQVELV